MQADEAFRRRPPDVCITFYARRDSRDAQQVALFGRPPDRFPQVRPRVDRNAGDANLGQPRLDVLGDLVRGNPAVRRLRPASAVGVGGLVDDYDKLIS